PQTARPVRPPGRTPPPPCRGTPPPEGHFMRLSRSTAGPAALLVATLALAACGSTEAPTTASSTTPAPTSAEAAGPVTYTDERGEHTLDEPADAVVSLEWGLTENLLALGANIVGQADVAGYNT